MTVAYIPMVRKQKEAAADERGRERRSGVLQRVLYLVFRTTMQASHEGVTFVREGRELWAFPRILLYLCDYPEEKAVLGLKSGQTKYPCSNCDAAAEVVGGPEALESRDRDAVLLLHDQLEAAQHRMHQRLTGRRAHLERLHSLQSVAPALAGMAGLSSAPFLMYNIVGFDALHVRSGVPYCLDILIAARGKRCTIILPMACI